MKNLTPPELKAIMLFSVVSSEMEEGNEQNITPLTTPLTPETIEAEVLTTRLYEIKSMDFPKWSEVEEKQSRNEIHLSNYNLKVISSGIYISMAALIIIYLLLLLI